MRKILIAMAATATLLATSVVDASARFGGMGGGGRSFGGSHMSSFGGGRISSFSGGRISTFSAPRISSYSGARIVGTGPVRLGAIHTPMIHSNHIYPMARPYVRSRFLYVGGGYPYLYNSCYRQVPTAFGWTWVNVCLYPNYLY